jgi:two-component system, OmpR family, phosphate regulon sensor histidine kinase PhoR
VKRLKRLILLFCLGISIPLAYVIWHAYQGLAREERSQLRFFSEALFDEIEKEMADLIQREENRAVDEYHYTLAQDTGSPRNSPLSQPPAEKYILGYLQNNPDGSFQTPLISDLGHVPTTLRPIVAQLREANAVFNRKKLAMAQKTLFDGAKAEGPLIDAPSKRKEKPTFAERYLSKSQQAPPRSYLGQKAPRKEEITVGQALNLSKEDQAVLRSRLSQPRTAEPAAMEGQETDRSNRLQAAAPLAGSGADLKVAGAPMAAPSTSASGFQAEVAPFQSLSISRGKFFIFRRIVVSNQIFRQGFVLQVEPFLRHLAAAHFDDQPMAAFSGLSFDVPVNGNQTEHVQSGHWDPAGDSIARRTFPAPFDFISANVQAAAAPPSPLRRSLNTALAVLALVMLMGLAAIYQSARAVVDLSERRSQFVSSVTHELKTPLTNIRMYIEMLDQGIAATPEREQEYLHILGSESSRLSRLINNVLDLAKLEKRQRRFNMQQGCLEDVFSEVATIMGHKLHQEGFELHIRNIDAPDFAFDREVLIQILINLLENSIKFGRANPQKVIAITGASHNSWVQIRVCDTGPGIPPSALKKVFDDFYRVDNELTRATGGTGIGLALVKKFISALGGRVQVANNAGPGCTITLLLPKNPIP